MKASERMQLETERLEKLAAEIERNPLTRKFREEEAAATLTKRKAAAERLASLDREASERLPAMIEDLASKEAEQKHHEERGRVLAAATLAARAALSRTRLDLDSERRAPEAELLETYDKRLDADIEFFRKRLDFLRTPGRISSQAAGSKRNIFSMRKEVTVESNSEAVRVALTYSQDAIKTLEGMKLKAEYDPEAVAKLKAEMPKIDLYEAFKTERNMERFIEPTDPLNIAAAEESHHNAVFQTLMEKVDKLLKTPTKHLPRRTLAPAAPPPAVPPPPVKTGKTVRAYMTGKTL